MAIQKETEYTGTIVMLLKLSIDEKIRQESYYREKDCLMNLRLWAMHDVRE